MLGIWQTHLGQTETEVVTKYHLLASRTINLTLHRKYSSDQLSQTISFLKQRSTYNYALGRLLQPRPKGLPRQGAKHTSPEQETCPLLCGNETSTLLLSPTNEKWPSPALHSWHLLERQVSNTDVCTDLQHIHASGGFSVSIRQTTARVQRIVNKPSFSWRQLEMYFCTTKMSAKMTSRHQTQMTTLWMKLLWVAVSGHRISGGRALRAAEKSGVEKKRAHRNDTEHFTNKHLQMQQVQ